MNRRWMILFALLLFVGCGPAPLHFCETTVHPDGRVDRAIIQHGDSTPDESREASLWTKSGYLKERPDNEFDGSIRDSELLEEPAKDGAQRYFAGWQRFESVDSIPDHLEFGSEARTTSLKRTYQRRDYGLFIEHTWIEELPNVITLHDAQLAQRELAKMMCDRIEFILEKGIGDEFNVSQFVKWCRNEGTAWFVHACAALWEACVTREQRLDDRNPRRAFAWLEAVCHEHGLEVDLDLKKPSEEESSNQTKYNEKSFERFTTQLISKTIQRKDGRALSQEELGNLMLAILPALTDKGDEKLLDTSPVYRRLKAAADEFIDKYPGGSEAYRSRLKDLIERIWGLEGGVFGIHLGATKQFAFKMSLPGKLIETNGELISESATRWEFNASAMFPLGVTMRARSIERVEFAVTGLNPALKKEDARLSRLIELVNDDEALMKTLQSCREAKSLKPLEQYIGNWKPADDEAGEPLKRAMRVKDWLMRGGKFSPTPAEK